MSGMEVLTMNCRGLEIDTKVFTVNGVDRVKLGHVNTSYYSTEYDDF